MRKNLRLSTFAVCLSILTMCCAPLFASSEDERVLELVNVERVKAGVPQLSTNARLTDSAGKYALYLGQAEFFSHIGPDGSTLITRNIAAGYKDAMWLGENIAAGFSTPEATVSAWMNSLPHRSNILDPNFAEIGIASIEVPGSPYGHYWVQEFGMRRGVVPRPGDPRALERAGSAPALPIPERKGVVSAGGLLGEPDTSSGSDAAAPVITSLSPASALHGATVTVKGRGFGPSGTLRFGGLIASVKAWTDTVITATVPRGAISSGVSVTNDTGIISRGYGFRVAPAAVAAAAPQKALQDASKTVE